MKRRPERLRLEMAFLLGVIIGTLSFPSHPLLTSPPVFCHSHPSSPLYFSVLEGTLCPAIPCLAERRHLFRFLCDNKQTNESDRGSEIEIGRKIYGDVFGLETKSCCCGIALESFIKNTGTTFKVSSKMTVHETLEEPV